MSLMAINGNMDWSELSDEQIRRELDREEKDTEILMNAGGQPRFKSGEEFVDAWFAGSGSAYAKVNVIPSDKESDCFSRLDVFIGKGDDLSLFLLRTFKSVMWCGNKNKPHSLVVLHLVQDKWKDKKWSTLKPEFEWLANQYHCRIHLKILGHSSTKLL